MEQRSYKIYKIYNTVNNNIYIGQTVNSLETRLAQHSKCFTSKLSIAMKELGKDKFKIKLLDISAKSNEELSALEDKYIIFHDSINNGYNTRPSAKSTADLHKSLKPYITITIDTDILKQVQTLAEEEARTISSQINKILKDFVISK